MQGVDILPFQDRSPEIRPQGVRPEFYMDAVIDAGASAQAGRPIWRDMEYVKIIIPGVITNIHVKVVGELEKRRWPAEYAAFRQGIDQPLDGTPLSEWPILTKAMIKELAHWEVRTVEELAGLSDIGIQNIGIHGRNLRDQAKAYLSDAERGALASRLSAENEKLHNRIAVLENQVGELGNLLSRIDSERRELADRPHPYATAVPTNYDMLAPQNFPAQPVQVRSALDNLPMRRGRPRDPETGQFLPQDEPPAAA